MTDYKGIDIKCGNCNNFIPVIAPTGTFLSFSKAMCTDCSSSENSSEIVFR